MNRTITAVVFIIIAVALGVVSLIYVENTYTSMNFLLEEISETAQNNDAKTTTQLLEKADKKWESHQKVLNVFLGQQETLQVKENLKNAILFSEHEDTKTSLIYIHECQVELYRIRETYRPSWHTIL